MLKAYEVAIDSDTVLVSILAMTSITSKELHEQTGALLVPATDQVDPPWDEIMAEVRKARAQDKPPRPNPILAERKKRRYAAGVRR